MRAAATAAATASALPLPHPHPHPHPHPLPRCRYRYPAAGTRIRSPLPHPAMIYTPADITTWSADSLFVRLDSLRGRLAAEKDEDVRVFICLQIDDVRAEIKRRTAARISAIASAALS